MAEHQLPKLNTGVRFPSPAPKTASIKGYLPFLYFFAFYSRLAFLSSTRRPLANSRPAPDGSPSPLSLRDISPHRGESPFTREPITIRVPRLINKIH